MTTDHPQLSVRRCSSQRTSRTSRTNKLISYSSSDTQTHSSVSRITTSSNHTPLKDLEKIPTLKDLEKIPTLPLQTDPQTSRDQPLKWAESVHDIKWKVREKYKASKYPKTVRLSYTPIATNGSIYQRDRSCSLQDGKVDLADDDENEIHERCRRWVQSLPTKFSGLNTVTVLTLPALGCKH